MVDPFRAWTTDINSLSDLGEGTVYFEFDGQWATRQVEVYGDRWLCSSKDYPPGVGPGLCDQPLSELDLHKEHEIFKVEFEHVWREGQRRCR